MANRQEYRKMTSLDQGFKTVVHDSDVLSWLIRSNVDEFKGRSIEEIKSCLKIGEDGHTVIGRDTELHSMDEGKIVTDSIFDVKIPDSDDEVSVIINIEGQSDPNPGYPLGKRAEYYMARLVSSQKGIDFENDDYSKLRKVYSIWYILRPKVNDMNTVVRYRMEATEIKGDPKILPVLDTFNIVMVNVGRYDSALPDCSAFPAALFSDMSIEERQKLISERFNIALDDVILGEVNSVASLAEDTYRHGVKDGKAEARADMINQYANTVIRLMNGENWSFDKVISYIDAPDDMKDEIEKTVNEKLN